MKALKVILIILSLVFIVSGCGKNPSEIVRTENTMYIADDTNSKTLSGSSEEAKIEQEEKETNSFDDAGDGIEYTTSDKYDLAPLIGQYFREQDFIDNYDIHFESEPSKQGGTVYESDGVIITTTPDNKIYDITITNTRSKFNLYGITYETEFSEAKKIVDNVATDTEFDSGEGSYVGMVDPEYCLRVQTDSGQFEVIAVRLVRW